MPGLDRTGPAGMGPMTGWGRGLCNPRGAYRFFGGPGRGRGLGRGWGMGRGLGLGRGRGRGWGYGYWARGFFPWWDRGPIAPWGAYQAPYSREDEMVMLKEQAAALKEELDAIEERLGSLETEQSS
ncbi:MAG: DUF5320 domain-containing protein [Deltaproteobacteria bacterium]|nr:DUF5320 domain-containing protein [Deltaproteobacteria bacterium]MBW2070658.1 DUF5320 domain-containing protein [Deltaproteobacteria bacterium]